MRGPPTRRHTIVRASSHLISSRSIQKTILLDDDVDQDWRTKLDEESLAKTWRNAMPVVCVAQPSEST